MITTTEMDSIPQSKEIDWPSEQGSKIQPYAAYKKHTELIKQPIG